MFWIFEIGIFDLTIIKLVVSCEDYVAVRTGLILVPLTAKLVHKLYVRW